MKKSGILVTIFFLFVSIQLIFAQDTLYVYRAGLVVTKRAISEIDSITFYKNYDTRPIFTDVDGNVYHSVTIGTQTWMVENLKTTKYRNGEVIGTTSAYTDITYDSSPKYQWAFNGTESNVPIYGRLYTWYAATDGRNIAPTGWHVATDAEWTILQNYLIANGYNYDKTTVDNKIAKSLCSKNLWSVNTSLGSPGNDLSQNNSTGLSVVPAGYRGYDGSYYNLGVGSNVWTSTEYSTSISILRNFGIYPSVNNLNLNKNYGFSIRCIKNSKPIVSTVSATSILSTSVTCGGNVTSDGGETVIERGICWSTSEAPTITNSKKVIGTGTGSLAGSITGLEKNTTYYFRAYATNSLGTSYGEQLSFKTLVSDPPTVTDVDGNVYHTVTIGTQTWMIENLKTTKYRNGETIGTTTSIYSDITNAISPKYQWAYNGVESNVSTYGRLYTWYAVTDTRNIAPEGWHVASDDEWTTLQNYLIANGYNYDKTTTDNKFSKSVCSNSLWNTSSTVGTPGNDLTQNNSTGLSVFPAGYRGYDGNYYNLGIGSDIWTSTEFSTVKAFIRNFGLYPYVITDNSIKNYGFSVRCIKNVPALPTVTTTGLSAISDLSATCGGNITFDGYDIITAKGVCWSTSPNPTVTNNKTNENSGIGSFTSSITGLNGSTTYYVRAYATNSIGTAYGSQVTFTTYQNGSQIVTDSDGNVYHTVTIGTQTWMVENLKTTKYNDGNSISLVSDASQWVSSILPAYCWYNNDMTTYKNTTGALYNWYAVNTGKLAPLGWHIPTQTEITALVDYLGGSATAGSKLKESGNLHWSSANTDATNNTGFTALPGGYRSRESGSFYNVGLWGEFWSSTEVIGNGGRFLFTYSATELNYNSDTKSCGFSVRCIKD